MALLRFPEGFLWGSATSSYQIEGAHDTDGRSPSIWDAFCREPGRVHQQHNGDVACDSYNRIDEDVALLKNMGAKAYRFSIAWPRVIPTGYGAVNAKGLDYYVRLVDALNAAGIEPMVTLYHWDLPQCLQDERSGWEHRQTAYDFVAYAEACFTALKGKVKMWITINEPWCVSILSNQIGIHAPGKRDVQASLNVAHHVLLAHGLTVQKFREMGIPGQIGMAPNLDWRKPYSSDPADIAACNRGIEWFNQWFCDPIFFGTYPVEMSRRYANIGARPPVLPGDMDIISSPTDFLGINYYTGSFGIAPEKDDNLIGCDSVDVIGFEKTDFDWSIFPEAFNQTLEWVRDRYNNPPVYITENGACYNIGPDENGEIKDDKRTTYYHKHLIALHRAIRSGCNVRGYMAWSLMDNFEWAEGYDKRFGLVHVDFNTLKRIPKSSYHWYSTVIAANAINTQDTSRLAF